MRIDLKRRLWQLTLPVFVDIALLMLVGCVDTIMLSHCGDNPVAAVGVVNSLMSLVFLIYQFLATGSGVLCAQYCGAKDLGAFVRTASLAIVLNAAIGLGVSAALYLWPRTFLSLMDLNPELMVHAETYLRITGSLAFFPAISLCLGAILRSSGRVVPPMVANIAANLVNVTGNYLLIFGRCGLPELGVEGAAWASAFARMVSFALLACYAARLLRRLKIKPLKPLVPRLKDLWDLTRVAVPAMSEELSYCLSQIAVLYFINRISTDALATKTYCANLIMFVFLFCLAATHGGDILIGHLVGRHRYRPAYLVGTLFMRRSMAVTLVCSSALALAGPFILRQLTANPAIVRTGTIVLAIDVILEIGRVRNIFACGTLRATGDVVYPVVVGVIVQWTVGVGVACLLGLPCGLGLVGIWLGFMLDENLRGVILMRRWHSGRWRGKAFA